MVSVVMITYNHEKYIEQAVRSALMQETDFDYEIIIGEDCSTDRTREIVIELYEQHPDKIRLVLNSQNLGMIPNFTNVLSMASGKYIALLEGDDYWTSSHKLQRQVDYMEAHPECSVCFHAARVVYEDNPSRDHILIPRSLSRPDQAINITEWLQYLFIATCTVVYRTPSTSVPDWYYGLKNAGDWPLFLWLALNSGEIKYIQGNGPLAVYRKHQGGVTHASCELATRQRKARLTDALNDVILVRKYLRRSQRKLLRPRFHKLHLSLANEYFVSGDIQKSRSHILKAVYYLSLSMPDLKKTLLVAIQCYLPKLYPKLLALNSYLRHA